MKCTAISLCIFCLFICLLTGCGHQAISGVSSSSSAATDVTGVGVATSQSVPSTADNTTSRTWTTTCSAPVNSGVSPSLLNRPKVPPAVIRPGTGAGVDAYGDNGGYNVNLLCGIDVYGRSFSPISGMEKDRDVGMFYFLWHGDSSQTTHNITQQLQNNPSLLWDTAVYTNQFHYWGEPLFGYYTSWDVWVLSRHVEMLTQAGVDYLIFDTTNGYTYMLAYTVLLEVLTRYQAWGWDVPQIAFYTNTASLATIQSVYEDIYSNGKYRSLWYCPNGKPLIIGELTAAEKAKHANMLEKFDLRKSQWPNAPFKDDGIPWMEWTYPQPLRSNGFMNVSVAQHVDMPFSSSLMDTSRNWGRGYNFVTGKNHAMDSRRGTNFQSQWDTVLANKSRVNNVFVTGWNEWVALKLNVDGQVWFVDCASEEFSRDIEPMKGGYGDNFYLQLCDNIRRYKGERQRVRPSDTGTLSVEGPPSQWNNVRNTYYAVSQTAVDRDALSVDGLQTYIKAAPRNTVQQVKLLNNEEMLYVYLKTEKKMNATDSSNFMNIYLGVGKMKLTGWNGYSFVVSGGDKTLYALDDKGRRTAVCKVALTVQGNCLQAEIPRSAIGAKSAESIYFKVTDDLDSTDIMDTYTDGNCLPMGRLSYHYTFG